MCLLSNDIYDYNNVAQGKITIPGIDDGEESTLTDVSGMRMEKSESHRSSDETHQYICIETIQNSI